MEIDLKILIKLANNKYTEVAGYGGYIFNINILIVI